MKKRATGFTLIELLAVIVTLGIILAIAVPAITGLISSSTRNAFESDAKLVLKAIEYKKLEEENYVIEEINRDKITTDLKLSNVNYQEVNVLLKDAKKTVVIRGQGKWDGLVAFGTSQNMNIYTNEEFALLVPTITVLGSNPVSVAHGSVYSDAGATAVDGAGIDLTGDITETSNVDTSQLGSYTVVYRVINDLGNEGIVTRTVNVIDLTPPVITMLGSSPISINVGSTYEDAGATAIDNVDGDISASIQSVSVVNPDAVGTYTVTYNVSDSSDNAAAPVIRTINVVSVPPTNPGAFTYPNENIEKGSTITVSWGITSSWGSPEQGQNYRLEVSYDGGAYALVGNTGTIASISHTVSSTANTIRYRVSAENSLSSSPLVYSNTYELTFPLITMSNGQLCGNNFTDARDSNIYATVQIGGQCWFAENLRFTYHTCLNATWNDTSPFNACRVRGGTEWDQNEVHYQWTAAMSGGSAEGTQGSCPVGWYVPTDNDIKILEMQLGMTQMQADATLWRGTNQGDQLKSSDPSWCNNATGCALSGFNMKPAGRRNTGGGMSDVDSLAAWWSSSSFSSAGRRRELLSGNSRVYKDNVSMANGFSVRCLMVQ